MDYTNDGGKFTTGDIWILDSGMNMRDGRYTVMIGCLLI